MQTTCRWRVRLPFAAVAAAVVRNLQQSAQQMPNHGPGALELPHHRTCCSTWGYGSLVLYRCMLAPPCNIMILRPAAILPRLSQRPRVQLSRVKQPPSRPVHRYTSTIRGQEQGLRGRGLFSTTTSRRMASFERLIRFEGEDGQTHWGDFGSEEPGRNVEGKTVHILEGDVGAGFQSTGREGKIKKVISTPSCKHSFGQIYPFPHTSDAEESMHHRALVVCCAWADRCDGMMPKGGRS